MSADSPKRLTLYRNYNIMIRYHLSLVYVLCSVLVVTLSKKVEIINKRFVKTLNTGQFYKSHSSLSSLVKLHEIILSASENTLSLTTKLGRLFSRKNISLPQLAAEFLHVFTPCFDSTVQFCVLFSLTVVLELSNFVIYIQ